MYAKINYIRFEASINIGGSPYSQHVDCRKHIEINDEAVDLEDEQPMRRSVGRNKAKKVASGFG